MATNGGANKKVCVTGAGGFVASWLVKASSFQRLLCPWNCQTTCVCMYDFDHTAGSKKYEHLLKLERASENITLFEADILNYESVYKAIVGCSAVFHVASPVPSTVVPNPEVEVIEPAVKGTSNVLEASLKAKVECVVFLSSAAAVAINPNFPEDKVIDESCWSDKDYCKKTKNWYYYSKTEAEEQALNFAKRIGLDFINILVNDFPQDCWESVFKFLEQGHDLESVSMVCKKFLSLTNQLEVIDFSHFSGELKGLLHQISQSELDLDLVNLSNQRTLPVDGLRELGSKMITLRVLICSNIGCLRDSHLVVISYCFPFLEELDISFPLDSQASDFGLLKLSSMPENLRKIDFSGNHLITDKSLLSLCENCSSLEEISFFKCFKISQVGIASAIRMRPRLASISFNSLTY
ncbi:hypothetical protein TSUD_258720 [Trifolium subterraneum]|uniref:3-beta hydroxysteroid dehydrogenase/isomerase domain-containing protein n=1 Tax=Trifolium subterraneum TaxID=3900 RepID=A0A2Z6NZT9_TRISU|nr:hypothetical protein TSUD_258720 [Trifolium subterraneum]